MKSITIFFGLVLLLASFGSISKSKTYKIKGKVTTSGSYCGGMAPTREMEAEARRVRPFVGYKVYVFKGTEYNFNNKFVTFIETDSLGEYELNLSNGEYILLSETQINKNLIPTLKKSKSVRIHDEATILKWQKNGFAKIKVDSKDMEVEKFHVGKRCFLPNEIPGISYTGPYPP